MRKHQFVKIPLLKTLRNVQKVTKPGLLQKSDQHPHQYLKLRRQKSRPEGRNELGWKRWWLEPVQGIGKFLEKKWGAMGVGGPQLEKVAKRSWWKADGVCPCILETLERFSMKDSHSNWEERPDVKPSNKVWVSLTCWSTATKAVHCVLLVHPLNQVNTVCMTDMKHSCPQNTWIGINGLVNNSSLFFKSLENGSMKKKSYLGWETPWSHFAPSFFLYKECGHKMCLWESWLQLLHVAVSDTE